MSKKEERQGGHPGAPKNVTSATGVDPSLNRPTTEAPRERHPIYWIHVTDDDSEFYYRELPLVVPVFRVTVMYQGRDFQIERAIRFECPPGGDWERGVVISGAGEFESKIWIRRRRMEWGAS
jgi:hypothetical protein